MGDLYYLENPSDEPIALTTNGEVNNIKNGIAFAYLGVSALSHSLGPDQRYMAYGEYNAVDYKKFQFPWYGDYSNVYGETYTQTFPKVLCFNNSIIVVHSVT